MSQIHLGLAENPAPRGFHQRFIIRQDMHLSFRILNWEMLGNPKLLTSHSGTHRIVEFLLTQGGNIYFLIFIEIFNEYLAGFCNRCYNASLLFGRTVFLTPPV